MDTKEIAKLITNGKFYMGAINSEEVAKKLAKAYLDLLAKQEGHVLVPENICKWKEDDGFYATECEHGFYFNDDGIDENNFIYCPYCGKRIQEKEHG